jgi:ATP-dependent DNA helicase PIF1
MASKDYITSRAILSTRNERVDLINMKMISSFRGDEIVYHALLCVVDYTKGINRLTYQVDKEV